MGSGFVLSALENTGASVSTSGTFCQLYAYHVALINIWTEVPEKIPSNYGELCSFPALSFVRSVTMDKWKDIELEKMKAGGNGKFRLFLELQDDYDPNWTLQEKYNSKAAALFRDKVINTVTLKNRFYVYQFCLCKFSEIIFFRFFFSLL